MQPVFVACEPIVFYAIVERAAGEKRNRDNKGGYDRRTGEEGEERETKGAREKSR